MQRILVVEDDESLRYVLKSSLEDAGYAVTVAETGMKALEFIKKESYPLVITDIMMPGIKGIELIDKVKEINKDTGFMVITAYGTIDTAVEAMKKGAFDFLTKPFSISQIETRVERFFKYKKLEEENQTLRNQLVERNLENKIIGKSDAIREVLDNVALVAKSDASIFIGGESGTGKELVAEAVHESSDRAGEPFLRINCAAVPETLFESTLFGHEKGSFSGAYRSQKGIFEECNGGTLLLDEISEIPVNMQAKLLRVLQEMKVYRVGNTQEIPVDVRIIATSNRNMNALIREGKFREDLFFRLNVFPINVPSLRSRKKDIPLLIDHFLNVFRKKYKFSKKTISPEAMDKLHHYHWPGNVRQLKHVLERAILYSAKEEQITAAHFKLEAIGNDQETEEKAADHVLPLAEMEKRMIYNALKKTNNHRTKAADLLGITVRTLRNKLNQFEQENGGLNGEEEHPA